MGTLEISSYRHRNGLTLTLLGALLLCLGPLLLIHEWRAAGMVMLIAAPVLLILGIGKLTEPKIGLSLTAQGLTLYHRRGRWQLSWRDIQRIDQLTLGRGFERREMPYIGFRLNTPESLLDNIDQRLAVGILNEQRNLLLVTLRSECPDCQPEDLFEDAHYRSPMGIYYEGVFAMLGQRMKRFRQLTGFDLVIAEELAGDNGLWELKKCWSTAHSSPAADSE